MYSNHNKDAADLPRRGGYVTVVTDKKLGEETRQRNLDKKRSFT